MADEQLVVLLEARVSEFEKRMRKAENTGTRSYQGLARGSARATRAMETDMARSTSRINQALATTSARFGSMARTFAGGFIAGGAVAAVTGIAASVRTVTRNVAQLGDEARRAGVSVTAFQELKFVAEQNRIGVDQMIDGLKELSLRADEFVVTGKGPAAEAFARLGYSAGELKTALEEPDELMLQIIGRLGDLDKAAQIRVADEVFGGSAGERFVELIGQGEASLRRTADRAHEVGAVLDAEVIAKAQELDRRFQELTARVATFGKELAVGIADASVNIATLQTDLDDLFATPEQARALLGEGIADRLEEDSDALEAHKAEVEALRGEYFRLNDQAAGLAGPLFQAAAAMAQLGNTDAAGKLNDVATEIADLTSKMDAGEIEADAFESRMGTLAAQASVALSKVAAIDAASFAGVTSSLTGFIRGLAEASARARELRTALPGSDGTGGTTPQVYGEVGARGDPRAYMPKPSDLAPTTSGRPQRPGVDSFPDLTPAPAAAAGGGGGAATAEVDAYREAIEGARQDVRELEAEAAALVVLATTGRDVGDALDFARKRAELLKAAQEEGRTITPELTAEIDGLAESYARAGVAADQAADDLNKVQRSAEAGADKIADIFGGILDGSLSARDAIGSLLAQMARVQLLAGFKGLASTDAGGGIFAAIGGALGFATGGYTGNIPEDEVAGVVHGREGVLNAGAMRLPGARSAMEAMNAGRMPSLPAAGGGAPTKVESTVRIVGGDLMLTDGGAIMARVQAVTQQSIGQNNAARDKAFVGKVNATQANMHRRVR